jgi:hypothetical protein
MFSRLCRLTSVAALATLLAWVGAFKPSHAEGDSPSGLRLQTLLLSGAESENRGEASRTIRRILSDSGRFAVRVCEATTGLSTSTFSDFDLVVVDSPLAPGSDTENALCNFAKSGKGVVVTSGALATSDVPETWPLAAGAEPQHAVQFNDVVLDRPNHPIADGMTTKFRMPDAVPGALAAHPHAEIIATSKGEWPKRSRLGHDRARQGAHRCPRAWLRRVRHARAAFSRNAGASG